MRWAEIDHEGRETIQSLIDYQSETNIARAQGKWVTMYDQQELLEGE